jgi:hypothetical protein
LIELKEDRLAFSFPEVHPEAKLYIEFQRTLRIPDDGRTYPLPPGLGRFPLRHVDDHADTVPPHWLQHGGVMLPMYQAEALWLRFDAPFLRSRLTSYPFAIKVATGKIDAVTGRPWSEGLHKNPQDYLVAPRQPWLDGYCVKKGSIRQFVAMPLGAGYTAEEQISHQGEHGGLQIAVYPMKREAFERHFPVRTSPVRFARRRRMKMMRKSRAAASEMGLAPGGLMRQEIYKDQFDLDEWHLDQRSGCFVHITNSLVWRSITGQAPPTTPRTARQYTKMGLPWFDYYDETSESLSGAPLLSNVISVVNMGGKKGDIPLPENDSVVPGVVVPLRSGLNKNQVREGAF